MLTHLLRERLRPYRPELFGIVLAQIVAATAGLALPTFNGRIIDQGVATGDTGAIWRNGGLMLAVSTVEVLAKLTVAYLAARAAMGIGRDLRAAVFHHVLSLSQREVNNLGAPSLITRSTNDAQQIQMLVMMGSIFLVGAPIMMTGGVIMALREDVRLSGVILVAVVVLGAVVGLVTSRMVPLFRRNQTAVDAINRVMREQIAGVRVIRAFVREPREKQRFDTVNRDLLGLGYRIGTLFSTLFPAVNLILYVSTAAVLWFGAHRVEAGGLDVGQLTAFSNYLTLILMSVMMATMMTMFVPRAAVSAERISEVLATETSVVPAAHPTPAPSDATLRFEHVSLTYPGAEHPVLDDLSFELRPGTTTAVIGGTGSGKTTLVNLIPRLLDPTAGRITLGGVDTRDIEPEELWARIGLVPQKAYLFTGTVAENLRYGAPDTTDEELWEGLRIAQADDFVRRMDGGLDAAVSQGGTTVSGGQRQRLSIARALLKRPPILLFDDAFSALDVATDARLRAALAPVTADAAMLIVGQRVSTIAHADQILVLEAGRVVGRGAHEELLAGCPEYREIAESQRSLEEAR